MKKLFTFIIGASFLLSACGGDEEPKNIELEGTPVKVSVIQAGENEAKATSTGFQLNGRVEAKEAANISTRVMGNITQILVKEGQSVRKGQILAKVNNADLQARKARINAQIAEAEAGLKNAKKNYDRFKNLYDSKSITQKEFNDVEMHYEMAQSRVKAAKEGLNEFEVQLGYSIITAPFSGKITKKMANEGDMANPGMPLLRLESAGNLVVAVDVPESSIKHVKQNDEVMLNINAIEKELKSKVSLINTSGVMNGGQYRVEVALSDNPSKLGLLAGMNAKVGFKVSSDLASAEDGDETSGAIWIPQSAVIEKGQLKGVYTVSSQKTAILRWVQLGAKSGDKVEVLSGVSPSDQVITQSEGRLFNGAKISVQ